MTGRWRQRQDSENVSSFRGGDKNRKVKTHSGRGSTRNWKEGTLLKGLREFCALPSFLFFTPFQSQTNHSEAPKCTPSLLLPVVLLLPLSCCSLMLCFKERKKMKNASRLLKSKKGLPARLRKLTRHPTNLLLPSPPSPPLFSRQLLQCRVTVASPQAA